MENWNSAAGANVPIRERSVFETWLHESLSIVFDPVLQEPVPDDLLVLLIMDHDGAPC